MKKKKVDVIVIWPVIGFLSLTLLTYFKSESIKYLFIIMY